MFGEKRCFCILCKKYKTVKRLFFSYENIAICKSCYEKIGTTKDKTFDGRGDVSIVLSPFIYEGSMREAIKQYKFYGQRLFGELFGEILCDELKMHSWLKDYDMVIPVPLHNERLLERGYNQSEIIARVVARKFGITFVDDALFRIRNTERQSRLSGMERIENVKGAFAAFEPVVKNKRIILIDDIYTMGATVGACADCLKEAGAAEIVAVTFAITTH